MDHCLGATNANQTVRLQFVQDRHASDEQDQKFQ